jgi:hypothetical protein
MLGVKYGPRDWLLTKGNTIRAVASVEAAKKINRKYDVPDLAGYSRDGKTLYIDKDCPEEIEYAGREIEVDKYLLLHELIEDALIRANGSDYLDSHQIACLGEKEAVETAEGMGAWEVYAKFMQEQINKAWNKKGKLNTPPDLDPKPYIQQKEQAKLKQMGYLQ